MKLTCFLSWLDLNPRSQGARVVELSWSYRLGLCYCLDYADIGSVCSLKWVCVLSDGLNWLGEPSCKIGYGCLRRLAPLLLGWGPSAKLYWQLIG